LYAKNDFFEDAKSGWFFYKDPIVNSASKNKTDSEAKKEQAQSIVHNTTDYNSTAYKMSIPFEDAQQREARRQQEKEYMNNIPWHDLDNLSADEYRRLLDTTREISVATPTKQYVANYAALQKFWVDKSETFAKVWQVAAMDDPSLLYAQHGSTDYTRKQKKAELKKEELEFVKSLNNDLGYIIIVENIENSEVVNEVVKIYEKAKEQTGIEYLILDYYDVPGFVKKHKVSLKNLPDNFISYRGENDVEVVKRFKYGYPAYGSIAKDTKFIFENAIEEKYKKENHKNKNK
jgi:hypothetical protein